MKIKAAAKLNLYLDITKRLSNGYHEIESVMVRVSLYDEISISIEDSTHKSNIEITCNNNNIPTDSKNIMWRAAELFFEKTNIKASLKIDLLKQIPQEGGFGGGSADGGAVLCFLNEYFNYPLSPSHLNELASAVGSDVPFCLCGGTALCKGIGEKIFSLKNLNDVIFVIVKPDFGMSTQLAYSLYDKNPLPIQNKLNSLVNSIEKGDFFNNCHLMYNVFEEIYSDKRIDTIKNELINLGAGKAILTGSGSGVFGVFNDMKKAENAFNLLPFSEKFIAIPI